MLFLVDVLDAWVHEAVNSQKSMFLMGREVKGEWVDKKIKKSFGFVSHQRAIFWKCVRMKGKTMKPMENGQLIMENAPKGEWRLHSA